MDKNDEIVMGFLEKVEQKKKEIGQIERPQWRTNCSFGWVEGDAAGRINIQVIKDLSVLLEIHGFLSIRKKAWEVSAKELGISKPPAFKWLNFSFEDWETDLKTRIKQIEINVKKQDLKKLEEKVNSLVSPEQRRSLEIARLQEELKD